MSLQMVTQPSGPAGSLLMFMCARSARRCLVIRSARQGPRNGAENGVFQKNFSPDSIGPKSAFRGPVEKFFLTTPASPWYHCGNKSKEANNRRPEGKTK